MNYVHLSTVYCVRKYNEQGKCCYDGNSTKKKVYTKKN